MAWKVLVANSRQHCERTKPSTLNPWFRTHLRTLIIIRDQAWQEMMDRTQGFTQWNWVLNIGLILIHYTFSISFLGFCSTAVGQQAETCPTTSSFRNEYLTTHSQLACAGTYQVEQTNNICVIRTHHGISPIFLPKNCLRLWDNWQFFETPSPFCTKSTVP